MGDTPDEQLSRRERQIMEVVYRRGEATVRQVRDELPDPPSYSAVRTLMGILERKDHLRHRKRGVRYVYLPRRRRSTAARTALRRMIKTYFEGSTEKAVAALLDLSAANLSDDELNRLARLIEQAKQEGR